MGSLTTDVKLPTLDGSKWLSGTEAERQEFANDLLHCLQRHGFAKLANHGISDDEVRDLYRWNRDFFSLSEDQKAEIFHKPTNLTPQRGWTKVGVERSAKLNMGRNKQDAYSVPDGNLKDAKEHLDLGSPNDEEYRNKWPREEDLPGFKKSMERHYASCDKVSIELLSALELALELPQGSLSSKCANESSELRLSHYPPISVQDMERGDTSRIWPHTDLGVITLLFQDEVGGLEVEDRDNKGVFFPVRREAWNEMVVNVSETLERMTNGKLPSGLHQVTVPRELKGNAEARLPSRYSTAFFCKADRSADVGVLEPLLANGEPRKYETMTALQFHLHRLTTAY